jgi:adenine-specific DNA-methyltransferase
MPSIQFKGKTFVQNHHLAVNYHQLVPQKKFSLTNKVSLHDNLIIQGDNLKALKALLPTFAGKIKCIYIDPPYNTGNENWVYNDNVNSPMIKEWLGNVVDKEDLTRHDKWLCMMMPRIKLLRELLSEDGVIFISIDDNENHNLRSICDEIFGDSNFVTSIVWHKMDSPKNTAMYFSEDHEYIQVYAKNKDIWRPNNLPRTQEMIDRYKNPDNDPRGPWLLSDLAARNFYAAGKYSIKTPSGKVIEGPPAGSYWRVSKEKFNELDTDNRIWWGSAGSNRPGIKRFLSEVKDGIVPQTLWSWKDAGSNRHSKQELNEIMSSNANDDIFVTPKPVSLVQKILKIATNKDSIILDSFAGSGTTAQAVLQLNKEDNGNRRFILVEQEEYADKITAERVRRVIKGVKTAKDQELKEGLGGSFSYFELGDPIEMESLLQGKKLPSYKEFARYLFYTATGEEFDSKPMNENSWYVGESKNYEVYLFYKPDLDWLKANALTLEQLKGLPKHKGKKRLLFAPTKFVDDHTLSEFRVEFCQLPYEIYRLQR